MHHGRAFVKKKMEKSLQDVRPVPHPPANPRPAAIWVTTSALLRPARITRAAGFDIFLGAEHKERECVPPLPGLDIQRAHVYPQLTPRATHLSPLRG